MNIKVVGASGFVGSAVVRALLEAGHPATGIRAPRLGAEATTTPDDERRRLVSELDGADVVVNCAGNPNASSGDLRALMAANADAPELIAEVASQVDARRFIHISSAVVQGRREPLDDTLSYEPFSAYAASKIEGERRVLKAAGDRAVIYRPGSVHAVGRGVTTGIGRVAKSPFSSVAGRKPRPVPQTHVDNVGSAVAFLAMSKVAPPTIVHHPSEGVTNQSMLKDLGFRDPMIIPLPVARTAIALMRVGGRIVPGQMANVRRIELIWFGQSQARSWLEDAGWHPPRGADIWREMGLAMRSSTGSADQL